MDRPVLPSWKHSCAELTQHRPRLAPPAPARNSDRGVARNSSGIRLSDPELLSQLPAHETLASRAAPREHNPWRSRRRVHPQAHSESFEMEVHDSLGKLRNVRLKQTSRCPKDFSVDVLESFVQFRGSEFGIRALLTPARMEAVEELDQDSSRRPPEKVIFVPEALHRRRRPGCPFDRILADCHLRKADMSELTS